MSLPSFSFYTLGIRFFCGCSFFLIADLLTLWWPVPRLLEFKPWKTRKIVSVAPGDGRYCCCEAIMWVTHKFDSRALCVGLPKMNELQRDGFMVLT